jgi:hypothetical protein
MELHSKCPFRPSSSQTTHRNIDDCNIPKRAKPIAEPRIAYAGTQPFCHSLTQPPNVHQEADKKMGRQSDHPVFPSFDWPEVAIASLHVGHTTSALLPRLPDYQSDKMEGDEGKERHPVR